MKIERFMVIRNNGNIDFLKVIHGNDEKECENIQHYRKETQTQLDFAQECIERFNNEFPEWDGVLEWRMIAEDDFTDWYDFDAGI